MALVVETVTRQVTMHELAALFEKHDFNAFPVVEAAKIGIVTNLDFLRAFAFTSSQIVPHFDELTRRTVADERGRSLAEGMGCWRASSVQNDCHCYAPVR